MSVSIAKSRWKFSWEDKGVFVRLNGVGHERALQLFSLVVLAHWGEHLAQAFQIYALGWPLNEARGVLGIPFPWLVSSEFMHYSYAVVMLAGLWIFRRGFTGRAYTWWMVSFWIQFWHHLEHFILQGQVIYGENLFGAPVPISIIQLLGFVNGSATSGFGGLLTAPGSADISLLMVFVRRVEVHMIYNTIVFVPMIVGMFLHLFPNKEELQHMTCSCDWNAKRRKQNMDEAA